MLPSQLWRRMIAPGCGPWLEGKCFKGLVAECKACSSSSNNSSSKRNSSSSSSSSSLVAAPLLVAESRLFLLARGHLVSSRKHPARRRLQAVRVVELLLVVQLRAAAAA
jgi:hypothetical protein